MRTTSIFAAAGLAFTSIAVARLATPSIDISLNIISEPTSIPHFGPVVFTPKVSPYSTVTELSAAHSHEPFTGHGPVVTSPPFTTKIEGPVEKLLARHLEEGFGNGWPHHGEGESHPSKPTDKPDFEPPFHHSHIEHPGHGGEPNFTIQTSMPATPPSAQPIITKTVTTLEVLGFTSYHPAGPSPFPPLVERELTIMTTVTSLSGGWTSYHPTQSPSIPLLLARQDIMLTVTSLSGGWTSYHPTQSPSIPLLLARQDMATVTVLSGGYTSTFTAPPTLATPVISTSEPYPDTKTVMPTTFAIDSPFPPLVERELTILTTVTSLSGGWTSYHPTESPSFPLLLARQDMATVTALSGGYTSTFSEPPTLATPVISTTTELASSITTESVVSTTTALSVSTTTALTVSSTTELASATTTELAGPTSTQSGAAISKQMCALGLLLGVVVAAAFV
ncbi:hypothetical protein LTR27_003355 [Elasticomyces elasticus]|nr:hypothetical protein LTR27_003355 [Elasticomyces elasticus]